MIKACIKDCGCNAQRIHAQLMAAAASIGTKRTQSEIKQEGVKKVV